MTPKIGRFRVEKGRKVGRSKISENRRTSLMFPYVTSIYLFQYLFSGCQDLLVQVESLFCPVFPGIFVTEPKKYGSIHSYWLNKNQGSNQVDMNHITTFFIIPTTLYCIGHLNCCFEIGLALKLAFSLKVHCVSDYLSQAQFDINSGFGENS